MYLQSLLVIFCLLICSYSQDAAQPTQLPEDDPKNFQFQNATKLVELGGRHWVKRRTYNITTPQGKPTCEYAEIHGKLEENKYTLELGAKLGSGWTFPKSNIVFGNHWQSFSTERAQFYQTKALTGRQGQSHYCTLITKTAIL
uniref:Putative lipocalin n=1 Tax=Ixodes ricinus TaxID=34613 RepID=V5H9G8_IXORI